MAKVTWVIIIAVITIAFIGFPHTIAQSSANTTVSVKTDKAFYKMGDIVEISGFVKNPTYDGLYLKIFDSKAELVWLFQVKLDENNNYKITLPLSDPVWNESAFYVVTAKTGGIINTTSFEINPSYNFQENPTSSILQTFDKSLQNILFLPIVGIFIIGILGYMLYSIRRVQKNITVLKHESSPLITFDTPSPAKVHLQDGTSLGYEVWNNIPIDQRPKVNSVEFWITIKNIGGNTAKNITSLFIQKEEIFYRNNMKIEGKIPHKQVLFPELAPGEFYYYDFEISWDQFVKLRENNLFVGLLASYDKYETRGCSGIIFGIGEGGNYTMDEWFTCQ